MALKAFVFSRFFSISTDFWMLEHVRLMLEQVASSPANAARIREMPMNGSDPGDTPRGYLSGLCLQIAFAPLRRAWFVIRRSVTFGDGENVNRTPAV
jgi:hypothetical protein